MTGSYVLTKVKGTVFFHRSALRFINLFLLMLSFFIYPYSSVFARDELLTWIPPTTNSNGTELNDLTGFKVYYGTASRTYSKVINAGKVTSYIVSNLSDGTYYFAVTAYNVTGNEGNFSNEVVRTNQSNKYTLSVPKSGTGTGTVTGTGISCGSDCAELFAPGTVITLTAAPDANSNFSGWSGGGCTGTGQCSTTINANTTVTAAFTKVNDSAVVNPGFETGTAPWLFYTNGVATFFNDAPGNGSAHAGHVSISQGGTNVQLYQPGIVLEPNTWYVLSFKAYSNTGHDLSVSLVQHVAPYTNYGLSNYQVNLTTSWSQYSVQFTTAGFTGTINDGRLMFWLGSYDASGDQYFFDDFVLTKVS